MDSVIIDFENKASGFKFAVVAQSPATEHNLLNPLAGTESGRRFNMWLEAAGLLGVSYYATNAVKTIKRPGEAISKAEQDKDLEQLKLELKPFKYVIALGRVASSCVAALQLTEVHVLELPHPSGLNRQLNTPDAVKNIIKALQEFKSKL